MQPQANDPTPCSPTASDSAGFGPAVSAPTPNGTPGDEAQASAAGAGGAELAAQLAELRAKHTEVSDAYLRAKAEAENIRRRAEEDMARARKFAVEAFAESLLPVKDSLEAAVALPNATNEQLLEGVHATLRQLAGALERNKVVQVSPPAGTKFDPHQHQAISMVPADQEPNTVVAVLQKGYLINERVLRPALVTVAAPK
jgi:molecular chaperone GrpE